MYYLYFLDISQICSVTPVPDDPTNGTNNIYIYFI